MGKKKHKQKVQTAKANSPEPLKKMDHSPKEADQPFRDEDHRRYTLKRITKLSNQARNDEALVLVDRLWPQPGAGVVGPAASEAYFPPKEVVQRIQGLFSVWPDQAVQELVKCGRPALNNPGIQEALAEVVLTLNDDQFATLENLDSNDFLHEAQLARRASSAIAEGRDDEALELLKGISLRSKFRETRMFLRGLSAYYRHLNQEAEKSFQLVADSPVYGPAAKSFLFLLMDDESRDGSDEMLSKADALLSDPKSSRILKTVGGDTFKVNLYLMKINDLLTKAKPNAALHQLSELISTGDRTITGRFIRDLAAALLSMGLDAEAVVGRLTKALPVADPMDPHRHHLKALILEHGQFPEGALSAWDQYRQEIQMGKTALKREAAVLAAGAIAEHQAKIHFQLYKEINADHFFHFADRSEEKLTIDKAIKYARQAVDLDPGAVEYWHTLL
ncbi:MAG: hypothetical protein HQK55_16945, partial [Deltaproteobacteria bacterium]|nr:hypothetical protein [Deltaproteobacteria bacterium]